ncbi:hypothetical protein [Acidovorax sp. BLS4]|uniref:hypothetical protein n=1 Tax=Acidovorax sp. BLS4 TaxID=3273430 RepID=UPI002942CDDC|nr:hypothetical protein [Paracidovorax avenae]WOI43853.1 hypothetical protein R1Z03_15055 [Paracidovorax avenae]
MDLYQEIRSHAVVTAADSNLKRNTCVVNEQGDTDPRVRAVRHLSRTKFWTAGPTGRSTGTSLLRRYTDHPDETPFLRRAEGA